MGDFRREGARLWGLWGLMGCRRLYGGNSRQITSGDIRAAGLARLQVYGCEQSACQVPAILLNLSRAVDFRV